MTSIPDFMPVLSHGGHSTPEAGACVMEMVSFLAGEEWSDRPKCSYTPITLLAQFVNDCVSDENRHLVGDLIGRLMNTADVEKSRKHYNKRVAEAMKHPKYDEFRKYGQRFNTFPDEKNGIWMVNAILVHARQSKGNETLTNQEYDQAMVQVLADVLDIVDVLLDRKPELVDLTKLKELECQRA